MTQTEEVHAESAGNQVDPPNPSPNRMGVAATSHAPVILTFRLNGHTYGVPVADVVQIIEMPAITPLPHLPAALKGIINFHGQVVPVMDMRTRFSLPAQPYGLRTPIILADVAGQTLGLIVDEVEAVLDDVGFYEENSGLDLAMHLLNSRSLMPEQTLFSRLVRAGDQLVPLLQMNALLTGHERHKLDQVTSQQTASGAQV